MPLSRVRVARHIHLHTLSLRAAIEETVAARCGGVINVAAGLLIDTACACRMKAATLDYRMAKLSLPGETLKPGMTAVTHETYLAYCDRALRYREQCDRAIERLGLSPHAVMESLDGPQLPDVPALPGPQTDAASVVIDQQATADSAGDDSQIPY